jgi:hypothetical protein
VAVSGAGGCYTPEEAVNREPARIDADEIVTAQYATAFN